MYNNEKTVLITGASYGIGRALAQLFAKDGYAIVAVSRQKEKLELVKKEIEAEYKISVVIIPLDLSITGAAEELYHVISAKKLTIDVLVNNAGFGDYGQFVDSDLETQKQMIELNITSLTVLSRLFGAEMKIKKSGKILNVASVAAFFAGPKMSVYYGTKAYVRSFSLALSEELKGSGVIVTCLCPGPTRTEFGKRSGVASKRLFHMQTTTAESVADEGYAGLMQGKRLVVSGFMNNLQVFLNRFVPEPISTRLVSLMHS